jgi:hypothetical protein
MTNHNLPLPPVPSEQSADDWSPDGAHPPPATASAISHTDNAGLVWIVGALVAFFAGLLLEKPVLMLVALPLFACSIGVRSRERRKALRSLAPTDERAVRRQLRGRRISIGLSIVVWLFWFAMRIQRG